MAWSRMVDMAYTDDEKLEQPMPFPMDDHPDYPPGLAFCLTHYELDKLERENNLKPGDVIEIQAIVKVGNSSMMEGGKCRIECQITGLAVEEGEDGPLDGDHDD